MLEGLCYSTLYGSVKGQEYMWIRGAVADGDAPFIGTITFTAWSRRLGSGVVHVIALVAGWVSRGTVKL